jgi:hypothetical protein
LEDGVSLFDHYCIYASIPSFFPLRWAPMKFFLPKLDWNHDPPNFSLPRSLGWQICTTMPSYWLRWDLVNPHFRGVS